MVEYNANSLRCYEEYNEIHANDHKITVLLRIIHNHTWYGIHKTYADNDPHIYRNTYASKGRYLEMKLDLLLLAETGAQVPMH